VKKTNKLILIGYVFVALLFLGNTYCFAQTDLEKALDELLTAENKNKPGYEESDSLRKEEVKSRASSVRFDTAKEDLNLRSPSLIRDDSASTGDFINDDTVLNEPQNLYGDTRDLRQDRRENLRSRNEMSIPLSDSQRVSGRPSNNTVNQDSVRKR